MMGIKETPVNVKTYYKLMKNSSNRYIDEIHHKLDEYDKTQSVTHKELCKSASIYSSKFGIDLNKYDEFVTNHYIDGKFYKVCNGAYLNKDNNYELITDLYILFTYAKCQKEIHDLQEELKLYYKASQLTLKEYTEILRIYYTQVHKELILNGNGYAFGNNIGWICVNRCVLHNPKKMINYVATKKREAELKKQGKRIYNKEEAEWCARNNIEYIAEDKRVFKEDEYCYEIPLIGCKLPNGSAYKLKISDYRHKSIRGKSNEELIEECKYNTIAICNLPVDLKTKLTLCDSADKILYTKFIRNETQKSFTAGKVDSKDR